MEELTEEKVWNRDLSQSYSEGIERIIGTSKSTVNTFQPPKEVIEARKEFWNHLLSKYSREVSDEVELELETLEPTENTNEGDDDLVKQRLPMRKSQSMVQHWINTGCLPYNTVTDQDKYSESGSSLSEEGLSYSENSPTKVQGLYKSKARQKQDSISSCSSVDTAAYILSNTNITKKAETIVIVEGAKYPHLEDSKTTVAKNVQAACPTTDTKLARTNSSSKESQGDSQSLLSVNDQKIIIKRTERPKGTFRKEPVLSKYKELSHSDENKVGKENLVPSSNGDANITSLESTEDAETVKDNLINSQKEETPEERIEKDMSVGKKFPVVCLERISPSVIKKHTSNCSTDEQTVTSPLRNTIRLNGKNVTRIQLHKKSIRSKDFSQPSRKTCDSRSLVSCQIQNVDEEDLNSNQSTALLYECKNGTSRERHSASDTSSSMNNSSQDIYNMANNSRHNRSIAESEKNENLEKWVQNDTSHVPEQIKTPEQEQANMFRRYISRGSCKEQGKNGLSKEEILEKIKCLQAVVALEQLPPEMLCNIRRYTRSCSDERKKSETRDSTFKRPASIDTSTAQLTNDISKTDSKKGALRVGTQAYNSQQFERKRTVNPIKRVGSDASELRHTKDRNRHRAIAFISSDEETEFIKLLQNSRSTKRHRTENKLKLSSVTVVRVVDTSDEESDVFINNDNPKSSSEVGSTARNIRHSTSQRSASRSGVALRKEALERSRTLGKYSSSSSEVSGSILTSSRVNREAISPAISTIETSTSPITVDNRISPTARTPKKDSPSPKRSFSEASRNFEHSKRISEKKVQDSVTPKTPATRLRFQTRLFDSDSESL